MIIGLAGDYMGVGKDTVADYLVRNYGYIKLAFATPLREEIAATKMTTYPEDLPDLCREAMQRCLASNDLDPYAKPTSDDMRIVIQQWGTEYRRMKYDEDYWVKLAAQELERIKAETGRHKFVFSDLRFPNEYSWILNGNGSNWLVVGPPRQNVGNIRDHKSEGLLTDRMFNHVVFNTDTLAFLYRQIDETMNIIRTLAAEKAAA